MDQHPYAHHLLPLPVPPYENHSGAVDQQARSVYDSYFDPDMSNGHHPHHQHHQHRQHHQHLQHHQHHQTTQIQQPPDFMAGQQGFHVVPEIYAAASPHGHGQHHGSSSPQSSNDMNMTVEEANLKRQRNTAASARFRAKKKRREESLERNSRERSAALEELEKKIRELEAENRFLKALIIEKGDVKGGGLGDGRRVGGGKDKSTNDAN